jgi:hypothetical protein
MKSTIFFVASSILLQPQSSLAEANEAASDAASSAAPRGEQSQQQFEQQLDDMQRDYDRRLSRIEKRLKETQKATRTQKANTFNPAISLILNGTFSSYENDPDNYKLPGYALSDEAGLAPENISLGESELTLGANVDQLFYGQATFAIADDAGETIVETEEAYFETLALGGGWTVKAGRFF